MMYCILQKEYVCRWNFMVGIKDLELLASTEECLNVE
jgi:hypothetical protein